MKSPGDWFFGFLIGTIAGILVTGFLQTVEGTAIENTCSATCQSEVYAISTEGACVCVGQEVPAGEQP